MPQSVAEMSTSELRSTAQAAINAKSKKRAEDKAMSMQVVEKGTAITAALVSGAVGEQWPAARDALGGIGYVDPAYAAVGTLTFFMTKGAIKEMGSGLMLAGLIPLAKVGGAKLVQAISG